MPRAGLRVRAPQILGLRAAVADCDGADSFDHLQHRVLRTPHISQLKKAEARSYASAYQKASVAGFEVARCFHKPRELSWTSEGYETKSLPVGVLGAGLRPLGPGGPPSEASDTSSFGLCLHQAAAMRLWVFYWRAL